MESGEELEGRGNRWSFEGGGGQLEGGGTLLGYKIRSKSRRSGVLFGSLNV